MATTKRQVLGELGEMLVVKQCSCPKCKRRGTLRRLPKNFKCADVICDFCGYLAQVKAATVNDVDRIPQRILGAAWGPQEERMQAGIYFSLFLVLVNGTTKAIYFLPGELQRSEIFIPRKPLSSAAKRAGWRGFYYDLRPVQHALVRIN